MQYGTCAFATGGLAGIGKSLANQLTKQSINIVLAARNAEKLEKAKRELETEKTTMVRSVSVDLAQVEALSAQAAI
jgi:short-subunit dehydrogenase